MASELTEGICEKCGAETLTGKIQDFFNQFYGNPPTFVLDAEPVIVPSDDLYRPYYSMGSGHYVKPLSGTVHRVHVCPSDS